MQPLGRVAKKRRLLRQVNIDPSEENRLTGALILTIYTDGKVKREHRRIVTQLAQRGDERVVVEAISTKHVTRAGRELNDSQASREW